MASFAGIRQSLRHEQIKWVEEHNIHITLKFFGDTPENSIPAISEVLRSRAIQTPRLTLRLSGLGIFGSSYAPRVVWAGIEPYAALAALMKAVHNDLRAVGYEPDRQNLVPHLTLGRIRELRDKTLFNRTLDHFRGVASLPMTIDRMVLYESILRREGPQYIALGTFDFLKSELP